MLFKNILNLFYPKLCGACSNPIINSIDELCIACEIHLIYESQPNTSKIGKTLRGRVAIIKGAFFIDYTKKEGIQQVLHSIKYQNQKKLGIYLAEELAKKLGKEFFKSIDLLISVPLHPKKLALRGFNQADLLAYGVQKHFDIPLDSTSFIRKVFTESQTKKNKLERWENVQNAFEVTNKKALHKKHILLLDDVFTTGGTLEACIKTLQKEVDCTCSILTLARA